MLHEFFSVFLSCFVSFGGNGPNYPMNSIMSVKEKPTKKPPQHFFNTGRTLLDSVVKYSSKRASHILEPMEGTLMKAIFGNPGRKNYKGEFWTLPGVHWHTSGGFDRIHAFPQFHLRFTHGFRPSFGGA